MGVDAEMAPTERAAAFRFTFPESETSGVVIDAFDKGSYIKVIPEENTVVGYTTRNSGGVPENFRNWFVLKFDKPIEGAGVYNGKETVKGLEFKGNHALAAVKSEAKARWNEILGHIEVAGGTEEQYRTFYSCLYRSTLFPRKFYEVTSKGEIMHYSPYNGEVRLGYMYTDTGFRDTFRALFPLLNLVYPSVNREIQLALANIAEENPFLPEWSSPGHRGCMVGDNSASVVADAIVKSVSVEKLETLYRAIVCGTEHVLPEANSSGRLGHEYYNTLGYIPYNVGINENVARTLEYAYDDWCILQIAKKLNRPSGEIEKWTKRALNYRNVFDASSKLMRGRNADGTFQSPFSPYKWGDAFTEGNAYTKSPKCRWQIWEIMPTAISLHST